jgi:hypothetical protein
MIPWPAVVAWCRSLVATPGRRHAARPAVAGLTCTRQPDGGILVMRLDTSLQADRRSRQSGFLCPTIRWSGIREYKTAPAEISGPFL